MISPRMARPIAPAGGERPGSVNSSRFSARGLDGRPDADRYPGAVSTRKESLLFQCDAECGPETPSILQISPP
jgi:hypothetical protein